MNQKLAKAFRKARRSLDKKGKVSDLDISRIERHREREHRLSLITIKPIKVRAHKANDPIAQTWPRTKDQNKQSRPVIVVHPVRALIKARGLSPSSDRAKEMRSWMGGMPKHAIDQFIGGGL